VVNAARRGSMAAVSTGVNVRSDRRGASALAAGRRANDTRHRAAVRWTIGYVFAAKNNEAATDSVLELKT